MVHAIRIKKGTMQYCNKYTLTDKLISEMQFGKPVIMRVGEMTSGINGLVKTGSERYRERYGVIFLNLRSSKKDMPILLS